MTTINTNNAKTELISTLQDSNRRVTEWFSKIPADTFFIHQRAENIAHRLAFNFTLPLTWDGAKAPELPIDTETE